MTTIAERAKSLTPVSATTGIGSLPHHNIDAALAFSFRAGIPFLPQIPIRNPWEYMIAQALDLLPGVQAESDGSVTLNADIWHSRAHMLSEKLARAFERMNVASAFEEFEPSSATSSSWQPFIWEIEERRIPLAKIQIAGPMTSQWALKLRDGESPERFPELGTQIYRLVTAKAMAMTRRIQAAGAHPILFLDEPGLYGLNLSNAKHVLALQELRLLIQALRNEHVTVGLHCCSNTDWKAVLGLGLDLVSLDTSLSLDGLLAAGGPVSTSPEESPLGQFVQSGGRLSLGVIPTSRSSFGLHSIRFEELFSGLMTVFSKHWSARPGLVRRVLLQALYTPACGLALHSTADAEFVMDALTDFHEFAMSSLSGAGSGSA